MNGNEKNMPAHARYNQSGVIPFKWKDKKLYIMLITSRKAKHWIVPKGIIESDLTPWDSAKKEAFEEAGIQGIVSDDLISEYSYQKWGGTCTVKLYLMHVSDVLESWPEKFRRRKWLPIKKAIARVNNNDLKSILKQLQKFPPCDPRFKNVN